MSPELTQYFNTGGSCISDVWNSSVPYSEALYKEMVAYCSAHQLGDWANGEDPLDQSQYERNARGEDEEEGTDSADLTEEERQEQIDQCNAADPETAPSSTRQYCFTEYGIRVGG